MNLDQFDDVAEATYAVMGQKPAGGKYEKRDLKNLPDGEYWFVIRSAEIREAKSRPIVEWTLEVGGDSPHTGRQFGHAYWLQRQDGTMDDIAIKRLNEDLKTLGFDVPQWTKGNGRPWGQELPKAIVVIPGVGFKGKKVTNDKGYANLYVNERAGDDAKPATFGPDEMKPAEDPFAVN